MSRFEVKKPKRVEKGWGHELWIHNDKDYCGKILVFEENSKFSMHYHVLKDETWYVIDGEIALTTIDKDTTERHIIELRPGDVIEIPKGLPHQLETGSRGARVMEVSTEHFEFDSYRIEPGDSQK